MKKSITTLFLLAMFFCPLSYGQNRFFTFRNDTEDHKELKTIREKVIRKFLYTTAPGDDNEPKTTKKLEPKAAHDFLMSLHFFLNDQTISKKKCFFNDPGEKTERPCFFKFNFDENKLTLMVPDQNIVSIPEGRGSRLPLG